MWGWLFLRRSKYSEEERDLALKMMENKSIRVVSKTLKIPANTLRDWKKKEDKIKLELFELKESRNRQFVKSAWNIIEKGNKLIEKKLDRALMVECDIEKFLDKCTKGSSLEKDDIVLLAKSIGKLGVDNIGQLSTIIGNFYEKQVAIGKEFTPKNVDVKLEDVLRNLQGDEM